MPLINNAAHSRFEDDHLPYLFVPYLRGASEEHTNAVWSSHSSPRSSGCFCICILWQRQAVIPPSWISQRCVVSCGRGAGHMVAAQKFPSTSTESRIMAHWPLDRAVSTEPNKDINKCWGEPLIVLKFAATWEAWKLGARSSFDEQTCMEGHSYSRHLAWQVLIPRGPCDKLRWFR